jgi:hypothetical protein
MRQAAITSWREEKKNDRGPCLLICLSVLHVCNLRASRHHLLLKTETGTGTGRGSNRNRTGTGNKPVKPVSMNRFFKKYIKYLNFNEKNIFLRF